MIDTVTSGALVRATIARFEAERQEAIAVIQLFLSSGVAVADHPNVVEEIAGATRRLAEAEDALDALNRNFLSQPEEAETND